MKGQTALMWAAAEKHSDVVKALIQAHADVNALSQGHYTALLFAARSSGARAAAVVARRDSGDETGDPSSVVGYAGVIVK